MRLSTHIVELHISFDPGALKYLSPFYPFLWLFYQQSLEEVVEIWGKELHLWSLAGFGQMGYIVETARDKRRVALGQLIQNATQSPKITGEGIDTASLK